MALMRRAAALAFALAATIACAATSPQPAPRATPPSGDGGALPTSDTAAGTHAAHISGTVTTPDAGPLTSAAIIMRPLSPDGAAPTSPRDVEMRPDGRFTFRNVAPGRYLLRASAVTPGAGREPLFAAIIVEVVADDVTDVNLILRSGGGISGRVTLEPETAAPPDLAGARVRAPLVEDEGIDEAAAGDVAADGTFDIRGLPAGGRYLTVDGLPAPLVLKRIEYRQQDITNLVIDVRPGDVFRDLRVVVTDRASEVRGTVRNNSRDPVPGALVVVLPASATFWTRAHRGVRAVRTDAAGRYLIRGLPPGQYRAFASTELAEEDLYRGEPLGPLLAAAEPLAITADTVRTLDLPLSIPARPLSSSR